MNASACRAVAWALLACLLPPPAHAATLQTRWTFGIGSPVTASPAQLPSGDILVASQGTPDPDWNALPNRDGRLAALRPNGTQAWTVEVFGGVSATPHVTPDGSIYAASIGTWSAGGRLYLIRNGSVVWRRSHERQFLATGALGHADTVHFLHGLGGVVTLRSNNSVAWERSFLGEASWVGEPAVLASGLIVLGLGRNSAQLACFDTSGEERWAVDAFGLVGPPQIGPDGTIYVGGGVQPRPPEPNSPPPPGGTPPGLRAHNRDGSTRWASPTPGRIVSAPVIAPNRSILATDESGTLSAFLPNGQPAWSAQVGSPMVASPAIDAAGSIFVVTLDGRLLAFSPSGEPTASLTLGGELRAAPLILQDGTLVVAGMDGQIHAVQGAQPPAQGPAFAQRNPQRSARDDSIFGPPTPTGLRHDPPDDGIGVRLHWDPTATPVTFEVARGTAADTEPREPSLTRFLDTPSWTDRTASADTTHRYWVRALNAAGPGFWSAPIDVERPVAGFGQVAWFHPDPPARGSVALAASNTLYAFSGDSILRRLDASGRPIWSFTNATIRFADPPIVLPSGQVAVGGSAPFLAGGPLHLLNPDGTEITAIPNLAAGTLPAVDTGDVLVFADYQAGLLRRRPDASIEWTYSEPVGWSNPALWADGTVFLPGSRLISPTGERLWTHPGAGTGPQAALGRDGTAYLAGGSGPAAGLTAVGTDGAIRWTIPAPGGLAAPPVVLSDDSIVAASADGEVLRVHPDGTVLWRTSTGSPIAASPAASAQGTVWIGTTDGRLLALNPQGAVQITLHLGGTIDAAPAIAPDGRVYVTATGHGIFAVQGDAGPGDAPWPMFRRDAARTARGLPTTLPPETPAQPTTTPSDERGAIVFSWQPVPFAEAYDILRGPTPDPSAMEVIASGLTGSTSFADRSAPPDTTWHYRVRARNRLATGNPSPPLAGSQSFRRWTFALPSTSSILGTPAIASDGSVRVCIQAQSIPQSGVAALAPDGSVRWRLDNLPVASAPVIGPDDVTYVASGTRELAAIHPDGRILWRKPFPAPSPGPIPLAGELAITGDGLILVPTENGPLLAFDSQGEEVWRSASFRTSRGSAPVVAPDGAIALPVVPGVTPVLERNGLLRASIPLGTQARPIITPAGDWLGFGDSRLVRISSAGITNLAIRWNPATPGTVSLLADPDGGLFAIVERLGAFALNPDGALRWSATNGFATPTWPVAALLNDNSLLVLEHQSIVARSTVDGRVLWHAHAGTFDNLFGPPRHLAVSHQGLLLLSGRTNVVAFAPVAPPPTNGWPLNRANPARTANASGPAPIPEPPRLPSATTGSWVDQVRLSWATNGDLARVQVWAATTTNLADATLLGSTPYARFHWPHLHAPPGVPHHYWLRATNAAGASDWSGPFTGFAAPDATLLWAFNAMAPLLTAARGPNGLIHTIETDPANPRLLTLHTNGSLAWALPLQSPTTSPPVVAPDGSIFVLESTHLTTVTPDGSVRTRSPFEGDSRGEPAVGPDGSLFVLDGAHLRAFAPDGQPRWSLPLDPPTPARTAALDPNGLVVLPSPAGFDRFLTSGTPTSPWSIPDAPPLGRFALSPDGHAFYPAFQHTLVSVNPLGVLGFALGAGDPSGLVEPVIGPEGPFGAAGNDGIIAATHAGNERWRHPARLPSLVALHDGGLVLAHSNLVIALHPDGRERWRFETPLGTPTAPWLDDSGRLALTAGPQLLVLETTLKPSPDSWAMFRADPARTGRTPSSRTARLSVAHNPAGNWTLTVLAQPASRWTLESSVDLQSWSALGDFTATGPSTSLPIPTPASANTAFFRLRQRTAE